jgi:hypothetical protein
MTGIDYPTITADGKLLIVRFSLYAQMLLSLQGVSLDHLLTRSDPGYIAQRLRLFAVAVSENYPDPAQAPGMAKWAQILPLSQFAEVDAVIEQALGKAKEELQTGAVIPQ